MFLIVVQIVFINFSKVFNKYIFAECPFRTEILATPLQYTETWEFMYEILSKVPPNQNPGAGTWIIICIG